MSWSTSVKRTLFGEIFFMIIICLCSCYSLSETYELKRQEHITNLQKKEEEMRQTFVIRVKEKEGELKEAEKEVRGHFVSITFKVAPRNNTDFQGHDDFFFLMQ